MKTEKFSLGQCSSKLDALYKIASLTSCAKSYRLLRVERYRYSVVGPEWHRNYFNITVEYMSTKKGGTPIVDIPWRDTLKRRPLKRWSAQS